VNCFTVALALTLVAPAGVAQSQDSPPPAPAPRTVPTNDIFSGTVTELSAEAITVERTALLRETVKRTFILDAQTSVEGKLRAKVRVTVRCAADESGQLHALHIIVR
jgi:hypothetical protein